MSIQSRLSTGLLLSLIIAFVALWIMVSINIQFLAKEYIASRLEHDAESLLNTIGFDDKGVLSVDESRIDLIYSQPFSGHYYVISSGSQSKRSRSLWDYKLNVISLETGRQLSEFQQGPENQSLLLLSGGYQKQGNKLTIMVAEDFNPIDENINQFNYWFSVMAFGMLLILVILQVIILRKSLKPLARIQTELKLLQQGKLRKLSTQSPSELQPLINEVNHLLVIMEQRLHRSRDALSDLAHAIKKPLTVIRQLTDKQAIEEPTKSTLIKQTDDIYHISDRILKRARLAGHGHSGALFSFADDLPALIKTLDMLHTNKNVQLATQIQQNITCPIDSQDMLELMGNLLDNAYKWAANKIRLSAYINSDLHICIEDDGPGVNQEEIAELSKRGVRLDEQIQGHGFGLAISTDIVNDYNGNIQFSHSADLGGFKAEITLPLQYSNTNGE